MPAGSSPSKLATRCTAERRSRNRVAEIVSLCSNAVRRFAKVSVMELVAPRVGLFILRLVGMYLFLSGSRGLVTMCLGRTAGDRDGHSGILPYNKWDDYYLRVFPISHKRLT